MGNSWGEDEGKSSRGQDGKPFRVIIERFTASSFCKKGENLLVPKVSVSFGQKIFDFPTDFCHELFKNLSKDFHTSISMCFSGSETSWCKCTYIFFSNEKLSKCLQFFFPSSLFIGFKTLGYWKKCVPDMAWKQLYKIKQHICRSWKGTLMGV